MSKQQPMKTETKQELFNFFQSNHNVLLLEDDFNQIINIIEKQQQPMKQTAEEILKKLDGLKFRSDLGKGYTDVVLLHDIEKVLKEHASQQQLPTDEWKEFTLLNNEPTIATDSTDYIEECPIDFVQQPTDEEIANEAAMLTHPTFGDYTDKMINRRIGFKQGAKWMRDNYKPSGEIDYKTKYEKCIDVIKRFDAGIISMYDL